MGRARKYKRAHPQPVIEDPDLARRLLDRVEPNGSCQCDGDASCDASCVCWLWTGHTSRKGYGQIWWDGRAHWVHRISYALFCGPIPEAMHVHHACHVKECVNPAHLEVVTPSQNSYERNERYRDE